MGVWAGCRISRCLIRNGFGSAYASEDEGMVTVNYFRDMLSIEEVMDCFLGIGVCYNIYFDPERRYAEVLAQHTICES